MNPLGCLRSDHNYAHLTAAAKGLTLTDVSCSGATTNDMTESQNVEPGPNPPQFNGLSAGTNVVSVTIGGNDIGFSEIIESCVTYNPFSTPCKDKYDPGGHDQLAERIANAAPKVAAVLQGIHARSPNARVFVVNYPDILPSGSGCWPTVPLSFGDVPYLHATEERLNAMLATTAAANGATIADWYTAEHRPRLLQVELDPLGRTGDPGRTGLPGPSQQSGDGGRRRGTGGRDRLAPTPGVRGSPRYPRITANARRGRYSPPCASFANQSHSSQFAIRLS